MWNIHKESRNTKDSLGSGTKHLLTFLTFRFLTQGERETQLLLCWPFHLTQQTRGTSRRLQTGLASSSFGSQLASPSFRSQLTAFFKNHQHSQPIASGHDIIHTPVLFPIWGFYYDICDCYILRAWVWTPALNVCICTCPKPNSSKPH